MVLQPLPNLPGSWVWWSWCSAALPHAYMVTLHLTRDLGRWGKGDWDQGRGRAREPEGGETTDIRNIQKWKDGNWGEGGEFDKKRKKEGAKW